MLGSLSSGQILTMQVDFYQLGRDPVDRVVPLLADKALKGGTRVVVVCDDAATREALSQALWARDGTFLAHGDAGGDLAERQPIVISDGCEAPNGATFAVIVDGIWREAATGFPRTVLLFAPDQTDAARKLWKNLKESGRPLRFFAQDEQGRWHQRG